MCYKHLSFSISCSSHLWCVQHLSYLCFCLIHNLVPLTLLYISYWYDQFSNNWNMWFDLTTFVVTTKVCLDIILRNMSIFLAIMIVISCIIIPIIGVARVSYLCCLIWWPNSLGSAFKSSMSILLKIVAIIFKSWCMHGFGFAFMYLMIFLLHLW